MMKIKTILLFTLLLSFLSAQSQIENLNELPVTEKVRAPEFDVVKKYSISVDSVLNTLFINEFQFHPEEGISHFNHIVYEIPLAFISKNSIYEDQSFKDSETKIYVKIKAISSNTPSISCYWFTNDELVSVMVQDLVSLGPWELNATNLQEIKDIVEAVKTDIRLSDTKINRYESTSTIFKYGSERATMIGNKDLDGKLYGGFYLADALEDKPIYDGKKSYDKSMRKLRKDLNKNKEVLNINKQEKAIHVLNIDEDGVVVSYNAIVNKPAPDMGKVMIQDFIPGELNGKSVKSKIVIIE